MSFDIARSNGRFDRVLGDVFKIIGHPVGKLVGALAEFGMCHWMLVSIEYILIAVSRDHAQGVV